MGLDVSSIDRDAMSTACRYVRHHPMFVEWLISGDSRGLELLRRFEVDPRIVPWLRYQVAFKRHNVEMRNLLDKADAFVNQSGQALMLIETYRQHRDGGKLDRLSPTRFAVHRAAFSLGLYNGAPVLASLRYVQALVFAQSGGRIDVTPGTISKHLHGLTAAGLIDYRPGKRGGYVKVNAGRIWLDLTPSFGGGPEFDADLILALSLTSEQRLALSEYAEDSARQRAVVLTEARERQAKLTHRIALPELSRMMDDIMREEVEGDRREQAEAEHRRGLMEEQAAYDREWREREALLSPEERAERIARMLDGLAI